MDYLISFEHVLMSVVIADTVLVLILLIVSLRILGAVSPSRNKPKQELPADSAKTRETNPSMMHLDSKIREAERNQEKARRQISERKLFKKEGQQNDRTHRDQQNKFRKREPFQERQAYAGHSRQQSPAIPPVAAPVPKLEIPRPAEIPRPKEMPRPKENLEPVMHHGRRLVIQRRNLGVENTVPLGESVLPQEKMQNPPTDVPVSGKMSL